MEYNKKIKLFYNKKQAVKTQIGFSRSPEKPRLLLEYLNQNNLLSNYFEVESGFPPFNSNDFLIAHTPEYVDAFCSGKQPLCESNGLEWSEHFARSVGYTTSNLYHALKFANENPSQVVFSPTSGFHHATPRGGGGFCSMSSQVISSVKLFREIGKKGCYLDLDGHYGNSIEDSRYFVHDLNQAVPKGFNFNPAGSNQWYINRLKVFLNDLETAVLNKKIDYVVWCHGADSHEWDDLGGQCTTEEWIECATLFYKWVKEINKKLQHPLPVILTLFGGYRSDDYNSVLSLHTADIVTCLNILCNHTIDYKPEVKEKTGRN